MRHDVQTIAQFRDALLQEWDNVAVPVTAMAAPLQNCFAYSGVEYSLNVSSGMGIRGALIAAHAETQGLTLDLGTVMMIELLTRQLPEYYLELMVAVVLAHRQKYGGKTVTLDLVHSQWFGGKLPTPKGLKLLWSFQKLWNFPALLPVHSAGELEDGIAVLT